LTGTTDPLELLFPGGSLETPEKLYQESPLAHAYNGLVQEAFSKALENLPAGRPLRVLEIGAGTGGTTAYVLPKLPSEQIHYTYTDISPAFLAKARDKFRDYTFVEYQSLNIERNPQNQGFEPHQYDLIVAANVIHATSDLRNTLRNVQQLLAPNGLVLMLEITSLVRWIDHTFGLTEGWWKFTDKDIRSTYPLLHQGAWQQLLAEVGFTETAVVEPASETQLDQALILAQMSAPKQISIREPKTWLIFADESGLGTELGHSIRSQGDRCILVSAGSDFVAAAPDQFCIDPQKPEDFRPF
jgi:microcystin synthetase protein McyG